MSSSSSDGIMELIAEAEPIMQRLINRVNEQFYASGSDSEPDDEVEMPVRRRRKHYDREHAAAHERLVLDYFAEHCLYGDENFRRRFRMSKRLFLRIAGDMEREYEYFQQRPDGRGKLGLSCFQKCTAALRIMAYGTTGDLFDEYLKVADSTTRLCLYNFCEGIIQLYGKRYLRKPTYDDIQKLYAAHENKHGFPGMLGSIDCMHWEWANCPTAWRGQYQRGDHARPTIILEAVASQDLWIWHAFFGVAGSNNDINVLNQSSIFEDLYYERAPDQRFQVNGVEYKHGYYLADGIYPSWSTFVKTFTCPIDERRSRFKAAQEAARKDVERAFGALKQRWHVIAHPTKQWAPCKIRRVMYACIILHNMILEDEENVICQFDENAPVPSNEIDVSPARANENIKRIHDAQLHEALRQDLITHIWQLPRHNNNNND